MKEAEGRRGGWEGRRETASGRSADVRRTNATKRRSHGPAVHGRAPTALLPPVHAIEASEGSRGERAFFELPAGEGDRVVARGDAWFDDIRTRPRDARRIPVWGVLHPCGECNATLPALRSLSAWMSPAQHAAVAALQLPWSLESELHALRVWPPDAYLDLADPASVRSSTPRRTVCVLRSAATSCQQ